MHVLDVGKLYVNGGWVCVAEDVQIARAHSTPITATWTVLLVLCSKGRLQVVSERLACFASFTIVEEYILSLLRASAVDMDTDYGVILNAFSLVCFVQSVYLVRPLL